MRIAYFTSGTIGTGHVMRGLAIGRALKRNGCLSNFRIFSPITLSAAPPAWGDQQKIELNSYELDDPGTAPKTEMFRALQNFAPDLILVDLFWAPLRHILPQLNCEAWLLLRKHPRWWFSGTKSRPFAPSLFSRILGIEPFSPQFAIESLDPVTICNPDECVSEGRLRERTGIRAPETVAIDIFSDRSDLTVGGPIGPGSFIRWNIRDPEVPFPAAEWLSTAGKVVSGAGYNSFWEAAWLGYANRSVFVPVPRPIDDQKWRLTTLRGYHVVRNGADTLAHWIMKN